MDIQNKPVHTTNTVILHNTCDILCHITFSFLISFLPWSKIEFLSLSGPNWKELSCVTEAVGGVGGTKSNHLPSTVGLCVIIKD